MYGNTAAGSMRHRHAHRLLTVVGLLVAAAGFWALIERDRWSTIVLGVIGLSAAIMVYRMYQIWTVQVA